MSGTRHALLHLSCCFLLGITSIAQQVLVEGNIDTYEINKLYLYGFNKLNWEVLDSVTIEKQKFRFETTIPRRGWYRIGSEINRSVEIILGEPKVRVEAGFSLLPPEVNYKGSPENEALVEYQAFLRNGQLEVQRIDSISKTLSSLKDTELANARSLLLNQIEQLEDTKNQFYLSFSKENESLFLGKLAKFYSTERGAEQNDYFTPEHFEDTELASPLYYQGKLISYFQRYKIRDTRSLTRSMEDIIDISREKSEGREALYITAIDLIKNTIPDYAASLASRYQLEFPGSLAAQRIKAYLPEPGPQVGELAPEISLTDSNGDVLLLSSLRGKFVLVDFWASWCGPCRSEAPRFVATYNQYKALGFTIYSVSLDSNREKWLAAIKADHLDWHHVSDLAGWKSQAATVYKVRSIPATYLINPKGEIVAKDLRGPYLEAMLEKTLKSPYQENE